MATNISSTQTVVWPKWKIVLFFSGLALLLIAWFGLGIYLHLQVVHSRAKVEQKRMEAQLREERLRRGAQYQRAVQERSQKPQTRNALDNL